MKIEILGPGCKRCQMLFDNAKQAVDELEIKGAQIEKVTDMARIISYGVLTTPGIVIDGQLKGSGRPFSVEEVKGFIAEAL